MPREKSAGAIIFRKEPSSAKASDGQGNGKNYYLLLHYPGINRKGGHWEFTKGHVEHGEKEEETVKREVLEETGIEDLKILPAFKEYIKYFFRQKQDKKTKSKKPVWIFKLVAFFIAETKTKEIKLSLEHIGYSWLPYEEALKKITYKNSKELLKKANNYISKNKR